MRLRLPSSALFLALGVCALGVLTDAREAHAQTQQQVLAADALFDEGRQLMKEGRFEEAIDRFLRSDKLLPGAGNSLNLGECYEHTHRLASAWGAYRRAMALATKRVDPRAPEVFRLASENVARLEPQLAHLTIHVSPTISSLPDLSISRDGERVDPPLFNAPVPVDAGTHVVVVSASGYQSWQTTTAIVDGDNTTILVPALDSKKKSSQRTIGFGLAIGGAAALAGGLVFGGLAIGKWSSVTDACPNASCPNEATRSAKESDVSTAETYATISTISSGAGVLILGAGLVIAFTSPSHESEPAPKAAKKTSPSWRVDIAQRGQQGAMLMTTFDLD